MKATLVVIENDADHAEAMALVDKLMGSGDPVDWARMTAQARLIEAYERVRWPRTCLGITGRSDCPACHSKLSSQIAPGR